jgi:hypothetical protein
MRQRRRLDCCFLVSANLRRAVAEGVDLNSEASHCTRVRDNLKLQIPVRKIYIAGSCQCTTSRLSSATIRTMLLQLHSCFGLSIGTS